MELVENPPLAWKRIWIAQGVAIAMIMHFLEHFDTNRIEFLAKVKELGDSSKSGLVREYGYVGTKKDGNERLNFTAFYEALLEANDLKGETCSIAMIALQLDTSNADQKT
jgi:hypothetical protein